MCWTRFLGSWALFALFLFSSSPETRSSAQAAVHNAGASSSVVGIWDLTWITRRGPVTSGYLHIRQEGARIHAQIHGRGSVKASGMLRGDEFVLRGSRLGVPYVIEGSFQGDELAGHIRVLSIVKPFTGRRRGR